MTEISVVIPTYNQQERLALVLCGLAKQTLPSDRFEVVVVDDGSTDETAQVLAGAGLPNLRVLSEGPNRGRNRARNRGIAVAAGELVVFLDGDALPAPDLLAVYLDAYRQRGPRALMCGFQYCLADLEYYQDPRTGAAVDRSVPSVMKDYLEAHRLEMVVTEEMVREDFPAIHARAVEGGYPFPESRKRQEQVWSLFRQLPQTAVGWLGFIPHNGAVPRLLLEAAGGFDEEIPFSEGWELAYRLGRRHQALIGPVPANSYHLYHYHAFVEPEKAHEEAWVRYRAVEHMVRKHHDVRIRLLYFWFAGLWPDYLIPEEAVVPNLVELDRLYRELPDEQWQQYQLILEHHPIMSYLPNPEVLYESAV